MKTVSRISYAALAIAGLASASAGWAAGQAAPPTPSVAAPDSEIIVTGTRASGITAAESATPIKVLDATVLQKVGQPNLNQVLTQLVPSFVAQAFGGDTANLTLSARLRGLSPNHTLVLINGKRRHSTANLQVLGGAYQGGAAPDLDLISPASIKRIEVLEQGAAAQYGSDAIAGVVNLILKDNSEGGMASATAGQYYRSDGETYSGSINLGVKVGEGGFINVTGFYRYHGFSQINGYDRRINNQDGSLLTSLSAAQRALYTAVPSYPYVNKILGDAKSRLANVGYNSGYDFGGVQVYSFGTYSHRQASAYENYRVPDRVLANPAASTVVNGQLIGASASLATPGVIIFNRNGFSPREGIREQDYGITGGIKGELSGFHWDLSTTYGQDKVKVNTLDSVNASLFQNTKTSPTNFYDGFFLNRELTMNGDVSKEFDLGMATPLNLAFGGEYRKNTYIIGAGDAASIYFEGGQSYPGFRPTDAGKNGRENYSFYADVAASPIEGLKLDGAGRFEHYSDFGSKVIGKLTTRYDFNDMVALRGTVSNGFRAPTLAESFYSATNVAPTSATVQLPANSAAAKLIGFNNLKPEKSTTLSGGVVLRPIERLTLTVDAYQVSVKDRVIGSGTINGIVGGTVVSRAVLNAIAAQGNILDPAVTDVGVSVFTNGVNTRTRGIDVTAFYPVVTDFGRFDLTVSGNYNTTKLTKITIDPSLLDLTSTSTLTRGSPKFKINTGATFTRDKLSITLRETIYGPTSAYYRATGAYPYVLNKVKSAGITDLEVSYEALKGIEFTLGANNLFNKKPNNVINQLNTSGAALRPSTGTNLWDTPLTISPYGINGGYYYARVTFKF